MARPTFPPIEDDFTRALLRSADGDEPSGAAYAKAATALGVGAGIGMGASLAAPSVVAIGAAGAARWSGATALRLWALGVSGALLVGVGALLLTARTPAGAGRSASSKQGVALHASPPAAALLAPVAPSLAASPMPVAPQPAAELDADELAAEAAAAQAAAATRVAPTVQSPAGLGSGVRRAARPAPDASVSSVSSLAEQVQSLDRARVALGSGDAGTALSEIEHYRRAWPSGVFLTEASVLEIEALAVRGQRSLAAARAAAFVAVHPDSPQAERLRRLIPAPRP